MELKTKHLSFRKDVFRVVVKKRISNSLDEIIEEIKDWTEFLREDYLD